MRRWLVMTGGLLIWAIQFLGVYLITSVADVVATADDPVWVAGAMVFSGLCVVAVVAAGVTAARSNPSDELARFERALGVGAAVLAGIGILFQTAPLLIG